MEILAALPNANEFWSWYAAALLMSNSLSFRHIGAMLSAGDRILSDKSRQMNRAQRAILLTVISIDVLLILFPPFEHARVVG